MKLEFAHMEEEAFFRFKGGEGVTRARMFVDGHNRIMRGRLEPGCSIGLHTHEGSSEIVYVLSGTGKALYGGGEASGSGRLPLLPGGTRPLPGQRRDTDAGVLCGGAPARMSGI